MPARRIVRNARLVDDGRVSEPGWLLIENGLIAATGTGEPGAHDLEVEDAGGHLLCPGFVDIHVHGGGGWSGEDAEPGISGMSRFHRRHGTTALVVSVATAPWEQVLQRLRAVAHARRADPRILGSHLEGPFLDRTHRGAHEESLLRRPSADLVGEILEAAEGTLRQVTLAPELTDDALLDMFRDAGVRVAVGHTSATMEQAAAAFERGATILTHAFNGMPGLHHRAPGPVVAALRAGATIEVIADGVHVDPSVIALLFSLAPDRIALVTDAMAAAGSPDGDYPLGGHTVRVRDGVARLGEHGSLAGSTLTLDRAVRVCVEAGVPAGDAIRAATRTPARAIGETTRGTLEPGAPADLVLLDADLRVESVWSSGSTA